MRKNRRKKKLRICRVLSVGCFIAAIIVFSKYLYQTNQQKIYDCMLKTKVAEVQLTKEEIGNITTQDIPIPEDVIEKIQEKQAQEKAEKERIAKEKEEVKRQQVTSRGDTPRTETITSTVTGTKAEYQAYAYDLCINTYGWSEYDFECLVKLVHKESSWNPYAVNKSSGAAGLFQALPASKMASEGSDYMTNYKTQTRWGLKYIKQRYGTPAKAWSFWQQHNWY